MFVQRVRKILKRKALIGRKVQKREERVRKLLKNKEVNVSRLAAMANDRGEEGWEAAITKNYNT